MSEHTLPEGVESMVFLYPHNDGSISISVDDEQEPFLVVTEDDLADRDQMLSHIATAYRKGCERTRRIYQGGDSK